MQIKTTMRYHLIPVRFSITKKMKDAGCSDSRLKSQHFGRLRWADHHVRSLRPAWATW